MNSIILYAPRGPCPWIRPKWHYSNSKIILDHAHISYHGRRLLVGASHSGAGLVIIPLHDGVNLLLRRIKVDYIWIPWLLWKEQLRLQGSAWLNKADQSVEWPWLPLKHQYAYTLVNLIWAAKFRSEEVATGSKKHQPTAPPSLKNPNIKHYI